MSTPEIELTIERMVLHDLPAVPRHRLLSAIEDALLRLLAADGLPANLALEPISVPIAGVEVAPGASIDVMAGQIAQSIRQQRQLSPGLGGPRRKRELERLEHQTATSAPAAMQP